MTFAQQLVLDRLAGMRVRKQNGKPINVRLSIVKLAGSGTTPTRSAKRSSLLTIPD